MTKDLLGLLRAVPAAGLFTIGNPQRIANAANDLIAHTRQIADTAAAHQHDRVLLQVVPFTRDIDRDLAAVRQANAGDLPQGRVGLLGRHRADDETHTLLEAVLLQDGRLAERPLLPAGLADELV